MDGVVLREEGGRISSAPLPQKPLENQHNSETTEGLPESLEERGSIKVKRTRGSCLDLSLRGAGVSGH